MGDDLLVERRDLRPYADYHVHLLGPFALPLPDPLPTEVTVPADVRTLLDARAALSGSVRTASQLRDVFTRDAQLLNSHVDPTGWLFGDEWFERYLNLDPPGRLRFVPHRFESEGGFGHVAGTVLDVPDDEHVSSFLLALRRVADGSWRITADSTTPRTPPRYRGPVTADVLVSHLDRAGIANALVLSEAYWLGGQDDADEPVRRLEPLAEERAAVRAENDWAADQVARFPDRLVFACSVDPLGGYALAEIERCARHRNARALKLNLSSSAFAFDDAGHVDRLREVFSAAAQQGLAIVIHLEPGPHYGAAEVELFLDRVAPAARATAVQVAHLAGNGPGLTSPEALAAFARACETDDPRTGHLWFDLGGLVTPDLSADERELIVRRSRQLGLGRILFGSDSLPGVTADNPPSYEQWPWVSDLPFTDAELATLCGNRPPYID
jgi:predicted TIM-barrel fold metal-dependent hydrolase